MTVSRGSRHAVVDDDTPPHESDDADVSFTDDPDHSVEVGVHSDSDESRSASWWIKTVATWTLLAGAVVLLVLLVAIPRLTGSVTYTVLTGSMEPSYPPGTVIVVRPTPGGDLRAGDVITFQPKSGNPAVITHRIVSIFYDGKGQRRFITKGDANKVQDETQLVDGQIRGKLIYAVPFLGKVTSLLPGSARSIALYAIVGGLIVYALWMWGNGIRERMRNRAAPEDANPPTDDGTRAHAEADDAWADADSRSAENRNNGNTVTVCSQSPKVMTPRTPLPGTPLPGTQRPGASLPRAPLPRAPIRDVPVCHVCGAVSSQRNGRHRPRPIPPWRLIPRQVSDSEITRPIPTIE